MPMREPLAANVAPVASSALSNVPPAVMSAAPDLFVLLNSITIPTESAAAAVNGSVALKTLAQVPTVVIATSASTKTVFPICL
jgi:hypothetical protein